MSGYFKGKNLMNCTKIIKDNTKELDEETGLEMKSL